jgi:glycine cleavage system H protein
MAEAHSGSVYYKRGRFLTHLPVERLYTKSHYWLSAMGDGVWRVGFTRFAGRMLGEVVEFDFSVPKDGIVELGQAIGWVEGFKAMSDIYSVATGAFMGASPALYNDITLIDSKPYAEGWLYEVRGEPDPEAVDVKGYIAILDATIDKMLAGRHEGS